MAAPLTQTELDSLASAVRWIKETADKARNGEFIATVPLDMCAGSLTGIYFNQTGELPAEEPAQCLLEQ